MATQEQRTARTTASLSRAARRLFARRGFDAVSVDELAAAAGVTRGAFYHHFSGKEALFEQIFEEVEAELAAITMQAAARGVDSRDQLLRGCLGFVEAAASSRYRRIALIDGPIVLGVTRYREIDAAHFLGAIETTVNAIRPERSADEVAVLSRVLLAALCECALGAAEHRQTTPAIAAVIEALARTV